MPVLCQVRVFHGEAESRVGGLDSLDTRREVLPGDQVQLRYLAPFGLHGVILSLVPRADNRTRTGDLHVGNVTL